MVVSVVIVLAFKKDKEAKVITQDQIEEVEDLTMEKKLEDIQTSVIDMDAFKNYYAAYTSPENADYLTVAYY